MRNRFLFALLALIAITACQRNRTEIPLAAREDFKHLPAASSMILYSDVSKIAQSPLAEEILQVMEERMHEEWQDKDIEEFKTATGFDPRRDIHTILVGAAPAPQAKQDFCVIVHGKFDEQRLKDYLKQKSLEQKQELPWQEETVGTHTIYTSAKGRDNRAWCFADANTLYAGDRDWIVALLQGEKPETRGVPASMLAELEKKVSYGDQFWFAVEITEDMKKAGHVPEELRQQFPKFEDVNAVAFSARVEKGVTFAGEIDCGKAETSKLLVDLMRGGLAAAKLSVAEDRPAVDALNSINIDQKDHKTVVRGELSEDFFKKLREQKLFIWDEKFAHRRPRGEI